jgi:hypothetical protein
MVLRHALPLLLFPTIFGIGCGGSTRTLQSISISPNPATAKNGSVQLTATGTFNTSPYSVTPLTVTWTSNGCDNLCNLVGPVEVTKTGLAICPVGFSGTGPITAFAPANYSDPGSTQPSELVTASVNVTCP